MSTIYLISSDYEFLHETYVGSTTNFKRRLICHKSHYHNENSKAYNKPLYKFIRENGGWRAWKMTIIDSLTTTDKNEILKCERKYIEEQEFSLNKTLPSRTQKEWIQDHKEEISEWKKQYYLDHKEEMAEYKKQYYQDHKEELSEKKNEKIQCERCGAFSTRNHLTRHQRSKKCMNSHI
jgi:hypothetical protein